MKLEGQAQGWRISVDTGGTFTDVVVADSAGGFTIGKALTTPDRIFSGLRAAIANAAEALGLSLEAVLSHTSILIYGTTRATNAIVTGNVAKTAFLTTEGFPDVLVLREGGKFDPHDFSRPYPGPYIPRRHTFEITERIDSRGQIYLPLDEEKARQTLATLRDRQFEACAVSLLWGTANPCHELRIGELIEEILPGVPYTLSHQLNPILREYRRASSVAIDASIKPLMQQHLRQLQEDLREAGYTGEILVSTTMGGASGSLAALACMSFYPTKNLGAFGEGGMVITNDAEWANKMNCLRVHGMEPKYYHKYIGWNARMDAIQAAFSLFTCG